MRIETEAVAGRVELDPRARLRHYIGAFKRLWWVVAIPCLLGATLGWFTAPGKPAPPKKGTPVTVPKSTYYEATHILIRDDSQSSGRNGSGTSVNLPQVAYLVNTGEVPVKVAEKLGLAPDYVESHLLGLPRDQVSSIEVTAVGQDPTQVVAIADTAAAGLLDMLKSQADAARNTVRDAIVAQLNDIDGQLRDLNAKIALDPPDRTQLEAQQRSMSNQYSLVFEQFSNLANTPPPTAGLVTLQAAKARAISQSEYRDTLRTIRDGASYVTGTATTAPPQTAEDVKVDEKTEPPGPGTRAWLGGLVGLALGVGVVLLLDRFDARLRRREDVEAASGLTVIAEIPKLNRKAHRSVDVQVLESPRSRSSEAYRVIRGAIIYALSQRVPRGHVNGTQHPAAVLMVTSADAGEGKTVTVANLAAVFAEGGLNVLVINCDFRRPRIHRYLIDDTPLAPEVDDVLAPRETMIPGVHLVTGIGEGSAETNPIEVVALQQQLIDAYRGSYHVILLDTAPFLATNDASELLSRTDLVTVVVRSGRTTAESAHRVAEVLERFAAPVLGIVFNGSDETRGAQYYYYGYAEPSQPPPVQPQAQPAAAAAAGQN